MQLCSGGGMPSSELSSVLPKMVIKQIKAKVREAKKQKASYNKKTHINSNRNRH